MERRGRFRCGRRIRGVLRLLLGVAAALPLHAAAETQPIQAALAAIDRMAAAERESQHIPALAVAIVHGPDLLWQHAYGLASLTPARPADTATQFGIGSMSKLFTAVAIVQLRDAGKLDLDDPVARHLPWFRLANDPRPAITIRELLLQLGGMAREPIGASWADRTMPSREALILDMAAEPETLPPETRWKYSNLGYAVLGLVVEAASGESYGDYVTRHILQPLGMTETLVGPETPPPAMAIGYGIAADGSRPARPFLAMGGTTPAAGLVSTATDLGRFAGWMLSQDDDAVLSTRSRREMERVQAINAEWSVGQGLGFELHRYGNVARVGHAGRAGGFAGAIETDPASDIGVVALTNADDGTVHRLIDRIIGVLAPVVASAAAAPKPVTADPAWNKFVGIYAFDGRRSEIAIVNGRLAWQDPEAADPAASRIFLDPVTPGIFRFTSGGLVGENLTFELDAEGHVRRMLAGGGYDWKQ